uniref:Uncharacterized protein AlNc14C264G9853 n=1 Tax=Albugo laibachii Nc14 TaxID=890382 RepID=F0WU30_9STRA|nr:conserved hypothetical protein [Albugo laibachii Nc14]|eukprot:CCA24875.1 conserved hypothetical protein [Albugo laibachii Nc14]
MTRPIVCVIGYLFKKARQDRWQRRYFIAKTHYLTYYKQQDSDTLLACIDLWQIQSIQCSTTDPTEFSIDLGEQSYLLKATNTEEAEKWLNGLKSLQVRPQFTSSDALSVQSGLMELESDASSTLSRRMQHPLPNLCRNEASEGGSSGERSVKSLSQKSGGTINPPLRSNGQPNYTNTSLNPIIPNAINVQTLSPNLKQEPILPIHDHEHLKGNLNATCCIPSCIVM